MVSSLVVEQTGLDSVRVGWTAPSPAPTGGYQIVTTGINTTVTGTTHVLTLSQPGNHTVQVLPLSQHLPPQPASIQVTVRGTL